MLVIYNKSNKSWTGKIYILYNRKHLVYNRLRFAEICLPFLLLGVQVELVLVALYLEKNGDQEDLTIGGKHLYEAIL
jgi:hypothetical protein